MLTGITANALSRYNEATEQIEKSMNRLAKGTPDLDSHDQVRVSRFDNKIHSLKTAHSIVKQNQDLLRSALAGTDAVESITRKMRDLAKEAQDDQSGNQAKPGKHHGHGRFYHCLWGVLNHYDLFRHLWHWDSRRLLHDHHRAPLC